MKNHLVHKQNDVRLQKYDGSRFHCMSSPSLFYYKLLIVQITMLTILLILTMTLMMKLTLMLLIEVLIMTACSTDSDNSTIVGDTVKRDTIMVLS